MPVNASMSMHITEKIPMNGHGREEQMAEVDQLKKYFLFYPY